MIQNRFLKELGATVQQAVAFVTLLSCRRFQKCSLLPDYVEESCHFSFVPEAWQLSLSSPGGKNIHKHHDTLVAWDELGIKNSNQALECIKASLRKTKLSIPGPYCKAI
jgi:hypothetical protein